MIRFRAPLPYDPSDPLEQGGLLFGHPGEALRVTGVQPGDDRGPRHYSATDPAHVAAAVEAERDGLRYIGYWHSHPAGTPQTPSDVDIADFNAAAEALFPDLPWLDFPIITGGVLRCFRLNQDLTLKEVTCELRP